MNGTQPDYRLGEETELGEVWSLRKREKVAQCTLWLHRFGHELRLTVGDEFYRAQVCQSAEEILRTHEEWRAALEAKGWQ